mmetsp:Transcript_34792/g.61269  ORF Transcript_34792/g.61269 Transcript_34792/m.61269 type:complete len:339 (+) Transcript_34792:36-1052(+)
MICEVCNLATELLCRDCCLSNINVALKIKEDWNRAIFDLRKQHEAIIYTRKERQQKRLRLAMLNAEISEKKRRLHESRAFLDELRRTLDQVNKGIEQAPPEVYTFKVANFPIPAEKECEDVRERYLSETAAILGLNSYFPDFSVSELFAISKKDSMFRLGDNILIGQSQIDDTLNFVIVQLPRTDFSMASEIHMLGIAGSIEMLCRFINYSSHLLHIDLPFDLVWFNNSFNLVDTMQNLQLLIGSTNKDKPFEVLNLYHLETSLLLLYLNFRVLLLSRNISPETKSLFDVNALLNQTEESSPSQKDFLPEKFEIGLSIVEYDSESGDEASSDDSWEVL